LFKVYTHGVHSVARPIYCPCADVQIYLNNVLETGVTIWPNHGQVVFDTPPAAGVSISWTGTFDVPVRFDTDGMDCNMLVARNLEWRSIALVESINKPVVVLA